jgi:integrase
VTFNIIKTSEVQQSFAKNIVENSSSKKLFGAGFENDADTWATEYWLQTTASKSENTLRSYRKEATRWRAFLMSIHGTVEDNNLLIKASYEDVSKFIGWIQMAESEALQIPPAVAVRLNLSLAQCSKPKMSPVVLRQAVVILHGMYEELCEAVVQVDVKSFRCCESNPFKPFRRQFSKSDRGVRLNDGPDPSGVEKALSPAGWQKAWEYATRIPDSDASHKARMQAARIRLVMSMLRATWERRHAISQVLWQDIKQTRMNQIWSIRRKRKGKGDVWAPIPEELVQEIIRFRVANGRSPTIQSDELGKSIFWIQGYGPGSIGPVSDDLIYRVVKQVFNDSAQECLASGDDATAEELQRAGTGPHTIRHTMATYFLSNNGELRIAQGLLGHSSSAITSAVYDTKGTDEQVKALSDSWAITEPGFAPN